MTSPKSRAARHDPESAQEGVASVERALTVLGAFDVQTKAVGLAMLAERTGLAKSTLLRLIASLMGRGYLRATPDGRYQLGPAVLQLAAVYQGTVQPEDVIRPALERLMRSSGESASFNVREADVQVCLYRVDSMHALRDHVRVGQCFALNRGAPALVLRAFSGEPGAQLDRVRKQVVVATHGEQFPGTSGIAAPVFSANQALAGAVILSGPTSRFGQKAVAKMQALLLDAGAALTAQLGGNPLAFRYR